MQAYDVQRLSSDIKGWMNNRFMTPILNIEGGWEYWMQIDFPAWLDRSTEQQWDFRREVVVESIRLDWAINTQSLEPKVAVNLKCQTPKYIQSKFVGDVNNDILKLNSISTGYATKLMVAATVDPNTRDKLVEAGFNPLYTYEDLVAFMFKTV